MANKEIIHESVEVLQTPKYLNRTPEKKVIKVINKSPNALPVYTTSQAAGMDVRAWCVDDKFPGHLANWDEEAQCVRIFPGGRALIHTGLYFGLPEGYEMQVRPRSGLALKNGITIINTPGTLDADYTGELGVILLNLSDEPFEVRTGDRIAQLVINKVERFPFVEVESLEETDRNAAGFGTSGIK